ncbi:MULTISPECIES: AsnC family transcriptional regulator [unclassified Nonomuraea]|uniref:Lrp/AsnC family transcriptional regulator n=1 Tax=unclassified Nonomuraea TaxID=2593643 RepID=UPI00340B4944
MEPVVLDELDRAIVHALHVDGRAAFRQMAAVLEVSDQTVARRYRRLRSAGALRVVGQPVAQRLGWVEWVLRIQALPEAATAIADALARRDDTSWVSLTSGGTQIVCVVQARDRRRRDALLLGQLPRTPQVTGVSAHCVLRVFAGGPTGWHGRADALTSGQIAALVPGPGDLSGKAVVSGEEDEQLLAVLAQDGRAGYAELAKAIGASEMTARRRLEYLRRAGAVFFDVDIDPLLLGYDTIAMLWLTVEPSALRQTAEAVAGHPEVAFVAATTGTTNLLVFAACRDVPALYEYLETGIGTLPGVRQLESAPIIRSSKRVGATMRSDARTSPGRSDASRVTRRG